MNTTTEPDNPTVTPPSIASAAGEPSHHHHHHQDQSEQLSFWQFMLAGSVAGMVEHMALFPIDTLKTRMQSRPSHYTPTSSYLVSIVQSEGAAVLYRGITAMGLGAGPAHAVYFAVHELSKQCLGKERPLSHAVSGVLATVASDAVLTPMDVVKQRLQLRKSPYGGIRDCVVRMVREEGFKAFYRSYRTTVIMNAPYTVVHFVTYEAVKKALRRTLPGRESEDRLLV